MSSKTHARNWFHDNAQRPARGEQGAPVNWPGRLSSEARFDSGPACYLRPVTELVRRHYAHLTNNTMNDQPNIEELKKLYRSHPTARTFLDHCAQRTNNQSETKVDRVLVVLRDKGHDIPRGDIIEVFRALADLGCGEFVTGRRGWPSRFVWSAGMVSIARAAAGEPPKIEEIPDEQATDESTDATLTHSFHLRPETPVSFQLPVDLTKSEAERLAGFIRTLPIDSD